MGKLVASDEMYNKTGTAMDHVNNVLGAVEQQKGTFGKFVYDPAFTTARKA